MHCPQCRESLPDGVSLCPVCGATLAVGAPPASTPDTASAASPAGTSASASRTNRLFSIIAASVCTSQRFGIARFKPPIRATTLFSAWAFLFGPLYFLCVGLWRKSLTLALLMAGTRLPLLMDSDTRQLLSFLNDAYGLFSVALNFLSVLFTLLFCLGHRFLASLVALVFVFVFIDGEMRLEHLDLGISSAFVWFNSGCVWESVCALGFFCLLDRRLVGTVCSLLSGLLLWQAGLPIATLPPVILPALLTVLCGMMATYDRYRTRVLHQTFWW
ncbi:MAG: zinc-ribbon domain-containing protein [Bilophila sp.]